MRETIEKLNKKDCCGCSGCVNVCPKEAIFMKESAEGFLYPCIDKSKCINCGLCYKVCPILSKKNQSENGEFPVAYAVKNRNKKDLLSSSSGGVFISLANKIISEGGVVYGAAYDDSFSVVHIRVDNKNELNKIQGSKYVQSNIGKIYKKVKKDLLENKKVLFTGTPCQVDALKKFLINEYENLITCDLVCHGVPSQKLFKKYILYLEKKYKKKIVKYDFRNKEKKGWGLTSKIVFDDGTKKYLNSDFDPYYDNFLKCNTYRESCYRCKYCTIKRYSDITLADYWGILSFHQDFYDKNGVSLILINTKKGQFIINQLKELEKIETNLEYAKTKNKNLITSSPRNSIRDEIYKDMDKETYINDKLKYKVSAKKIIKFFIPNDLKKIIKKIIK